MPISVKKLLEVIKPTGCTLIAGSGGLGRVIKHINCMEEEKIKCWIKKNELMITTGYTIRHREEKLIELIYSLIEKGASALIIKDVFFDPFPHEVLDIGNKLKFPIILWPSDLFFGDLSYCIMEAIFSDNDKKKFNSNEINEMNLSLFRQLCNNQISYEKSKNKFIEMKWPKIYRIAVFKLLNLEHKNINSLFDKIYFVIISEDFVPIFIKKNSNIICIINGEENILDVKEKIDKIISMININMKINMQVGVSEVEENYNNIEEKYNESVEAMSLGTEKNTIYFIEKMRLEQLLYHVIKEGFKEKEYIINPLKKIIAYDEENGTDLFITLSTFVDNLGAHKITADKLFLHRNTLTYRLKKIEKIIGISLNDNEELVYLSVAFKLYNFSIRK